MVYDDWSHIYLQTSSCIQLQMMIFQHLIIFLVAYYNITLIIGQITLLG